MSTVRIPTPLRHLTGGQSKVNASGNTVSAVIENLESTYPGMGEKLLDENGEIKRFINVFVDGNEIRTIDGADTPVGDHDEITIVPAMAGGSFQEPH
ncbi:MAG: ubiquitin-like small modifier protein 1 [Chloroflexota bacterium]|nr:ubiquitin-like small modifier protein 1 [Chloroflexota bacterium]